MSIRKEQHDLEIYWIQEKMSDEQGNVLYLSVTTHSKMCPPKHQTGIAQVKYKNRIPLLWIDCTKHWSIKVHTWKYIRKNLKHFSYLLACSASKIYLKQK